MARNLALLVLCQGLYQTVNVGIIVVGGVVGLTMAPGSWMATLPITAYVLGAFISSAFATVSARHLERKTSFQLGLATALLAMALCSLAITKNSFWMFCLASLVAGHYNANANLIRFAAAEVVSPEWRERAVSYVLGGGLMGAIAGPYLANVSRDTFIPEFSGTYLVFGLAAALALVAVSFVRFPERAPAGHAHAGNARLLRDIARQPAFIVAAAASAVSFSTMNLLMAATPLAMKACSLSFDQTVFVFELHVIAMFGPGFFTGNLVHRYGSRAVIAGGLGLLGASIAVASAGESLAHFSVSLLLLGVGWNFMITAGTTLSLATHLLGERDKTQAAINLCIFAGLVLSSLASGALVTAQGWFVLNLVAALPVVLFALLFSVERFMSPPPRPS